MIVKFLKEKWLTLLLSVVLGSMLWLYANRVETSDDRLEPDFEVRQSEGQNGFEVIVEPDLKRVMLMLRGPTGAIYEATRSDRDVRVIYEPTNLEKLVNGGPHEVPLERSMVRNLPPDVNVAQFVPGSIQVTVHRIMEKRLPVAPPEVTGTPEAGYEVYRREVVRPKEITVSGPASLLTLMTEVQPATVDVTGLNDDFRESRHPLKKDYMINGVSGKIKTAETAEVLIGIRRQAAQRTLTGIWVGIAQPEVRPPAQPLDIEIVSPTNPISLKLSGPPEVLSQIQPESIRAFIDVDPSKLKAGEPRREPLVVLGLPEGVKVDEAVFISARIRQKPDAPTGTETRTP